MKQKLSFLTLCLLLFAAFSLSAKEVKKVSILGDSYSTFQGHLYPETNYIWYFEKANLAKTDVVSYKQTWWSLFIEENGYQLEYNNSSSGTTICNTGYSGKDVTQISFLSRIHQLGDADIIFIFGATNDCWAHSPIGEYKYRRQKKEDLYNYRPALAYLLKNVKKEYPDAEIYFVLNNDLSEEIDSSTLKICKHYKIDCIELVDIDRLTNHPSVKGMRQICDQINDFIAK